MSFASDGNDVREDGIAVERRVARGLAAGAAGMAAMGAVKAATSGRGNARDWASAPPAAKVLKRVIEGASGRSVSRRHIGALNNVMHVLYRPSLGISFRLAQRWLPGGTAARAVAFAAAVWAARLAVLPLLGLRKPFWAYSLKANARDGSYHLVYGAVVAMVYRALQLGRERGFLYDEIDEGETE